MACSLSYCIFPNALVMQLYVALSVTNIDFTSKTNNSWYKSQITAWKMPFERYDSYLSPNVKKKTHYPFVHVYFNDNDKDWLHKSINHASVRKTISEPIKIKSLTKMQNLDPLQNSQTQDKLLLLEPSSHLSYHEINRMLM